MNLLVNPDQLQQVISLSSFTVYPDRYVYAHVEKVIPGTDHLMIINDGEEITIVTQEANIEAINAVAVNKDRWRLINIRCGHPFYCVGFIACITSALANEGIDMVITSSFTKDLVMVMDKDLEKSVTVLKSQGFKEV